MAKFNIIGFNFPRDRRYPWQKDGWVMPEKIYRTCPIHHGILLPKKGEIGVLICLECGTEYSEKDTGIEERFKAEFGPRSNQTKIVTAKKRKKKYYDKNGNLITDPTLIQDIQRGANVISYKEEKLGENKNVIRK
jgi:DNA-directed RNA polymerase subunit M/transcription elongation factor TFIIS